MIGATGAAQDAVHEARISRQQSQQALNATINQFRLDQRAWVVLKGIESNPQLGKPWELRVVFTNTGKTPARGATLSCKLQPGTSEKDVDQFKRGPIGKEPTLIVPNQEPFCILYPTQSPAVTQEVLDMYAQKRVVVSVSGIVTYSDIFDKMHWLTFCRIMHPNGRDWSDCKTGNDTGDGEHPT